LVLLFEIQGKKQNQKYFAKSAQQSVPDDHRDNAQMKGEVKGARVL